MNIHHYTSKQISVVGKYNNILDNLFKYLPIETKTPENTETLFISHSYEHNHRFIEHSFDLYKTYVL